MIVEMSKITLLMSKSQQDEALEKLKKLGVLHVDHVKNPFSEDVGFVEDQLLSVDKALLALDPKSCQRAASKDDGIVFIVKEILNLLQEKDDLMRKSGELKQHLVWYDKWGLLSLGSLDYLKNNNLNIRFYTAQKAYKEELLEDEEVFLLYEDKQMVKVALISRDQNKRLDHKEEMLPKLEHKAIKDELRQIDKDLETIDKNLSKHSSYIKQIEEYKEELLKQKEFVSVKYGMGEDETLVYLCGYFPAESEDQIKEYSNKNGIAYLLSKPTEDDNPPTYLRNPKWIRTIKPVFDFLDTLPGYKEYDISFWFLLFFSFFFAMIIGDAGYGLLFLLATIVMQRKMKTAPSEVFVLLYVLSGATIVWGALTGTWFGFVQAMQIPFLKAMVVPSLSSFGEEIFGIDTKPSMMSFCFTVGALHLSVAHLTVAWRYVNSLKALSEIGKIFIIWGVLFFIQMLILGAEKSPLMWPFIIGGSVAVLFFTNPGFNIKNLIKTLFSIPTDLIAFFQDLLSYVRLFAVGYASVLVAASFNDLALNTIGFANVFLGLLAAITIFIGHVLNIVLGVMSVMVHGFRLKLMEFSGHLSMDWSGRKYLPFKE